MRQRVRSPLSVAVVILSVCLGCSESTAPAGESTPYRESLVAPFSETYVNADWFELLESRTEKGLSDQDTLWLISQLSSTTDPQREAAAIIALSKSRSAAAASAILLSANSKADYGETYRELCYRAVGQLANPQVVPMLATDYELHGYRTHWAQALGDQWGVTFPDRKRLREQADHIYLWWVQEGKARFFKRFPDKEALDYPDGPFIFDRENLSLEKPAQAGDKSVRGMAAPQP